MKKGFFLFLLVFVLLSGCGSEEWDRAPQSGTVDGNANQNETKPWTNLTEADHVIVDALNRINNINRLDRLVQNISIGNPDHILYIHYTIEGDPIYHDLEYDGNTLTLLVDTTEDAFGTGSISTYYCEGLVKQESNTQTTYKLKGCPENQSYELLPIFHDIDTEDYFAFHLKYGVNKLNEIDTKGQSITKDLINGGTVTVSDFQFNKNELNSIYKSMIWANFLEVKDLSTACNMEPHESYEITVWINNAERHYEWSACDESKDGKVMMKMVDEIIEILHENEVYQSLPEVEGEYL